MTPPEPTKPHIVRVVFPEIEDCGGRQDWYVRVDYVNVGGSSGTVTEPADAPATAYDLWRYDDLEMEFSDFFETDLGWETDPPDTWERDKPPEDDDWYGPLTDHGPGKMCYFLHNEPPGQEYVLVSPPITCNGLDPWVQYAFHFSQALYSDAAKFKAEIFLDNYDQDPNNDWYVLEERRVEWFSWHVPTGTHSREFHNGPWRVSRFRVADLGLKRSSTRLKFTFWLTDDVSAAAIDDVWLWDMDCDPPPPGP